MVWQLADAETLTAYQPQVPPTGVHGLYLSRGLYYERHRLRQHILVAIHSLGTQPGRCYGVAVGFYPLMNSLIVL